jgi:hypothetical protein
VVREQPRLAAATRLTLRDGLSALRLTLWDEAAGRLVPFPRAAGRFADEPRTRPG